jgi:acetylornithine deacetylase/succinyl-diaminopimelate desuccinylase-like protein
VADARAAFAKGLEAQRARVVELCSRLAATDSQNPPGDTGAIAQVCYDALAAVPGVEVRKVVAKAPMTNIVGRVAGAKPGRRLVFNGHLDTGPVADPTQWTVPPFGGVVRDGRIYGRGVCDMKAGLTAGIMALAMLAPVREQFSGEFVVTLVADEGSGAQWGTTYLLENEKLALGDAMLSGDVGSPHVARFGEKGFLWLEVQAAGKSAGGAHTYLGINAVDRLMAALGRLQGLEKLACPVPASLLAAIDAAAPISEPMAGAGETDTLKRITVNVGVFEGGRKINQVPNLAQAQLDLRFPPGMTLAVLRAEVERLTRDLPGISVEELDSAEPNWTDPASEIVQLVQRNGAEVLGRRPAATLRHGFSDSRLYRLRDIPCVVYGATPHNSNAPDEYAEVDDLMALFRVHALTAYDFLATKA